jgi:hypothetical protein
LRHVRALIPAIVALLAIVGACLVLASAAAGADEAIDSDLDGCSDAAELGADPRLGGQRNPNDFWDFFDTPAPPSYTRDRVVTIADIGALLARFGSYGFTSIDPLSEPPHTAAYHTAYDRTYAGGPLWQSGPPDGRISIVDLILLQNQYGHNCA